jgi:hypothetical protein
MRYLAIAETENDVEAICSFLPSSGIERNDITFVPAEIDADIAFRRNNIKTMSTLRLLNSKEREEILFDAVEWAKHWLDNIEIDQSKMFFKKNFTLVDLSKEIFMFFDYLFYLIYLFEKTITTFKPKTLILPISNKKSATSLDHENDFFVGIIGKRLSKKFKLKTIELEVINPDLKIDNSINRIWGYSFSEFTGKIRLKILQKINEFMLNHKKVKSLKLSNDSRKNINNKRIIIVGGETLRPFWKMELLIDFLRAETSCIANPLFSLHDCGSSKEKGIFLYEYRKNIEESKEFKELKSKLDMLWGNKLFNLFYHTVDISELCLQKLYFLINNQYLNYYTSYLSMLEIIKKKEIDLFMSSHYSQDNPSSRAILHLCENVGIPRLVISHGTQYFRFRKEDKKINIIKNFFFPKEHSHYAVVGDYVKESLLKDGVEEKNIKTTGSIQYQKNKVSHLNKWLYSKKMGLSNEKKTIVYLLQRVTRDWHFNYLFLSFDEMREEICDVMKVADELNCQLIIKPHPAFKKCKEWISDWAIFEDYKMEFNPINNPLIFSLSDIVIGSNSSANIEALDYEVPTIIYSQEKKEFLDWQQDVATPLEYYEKEKENPFIRSIGVDDLLRTCDRILNEPNLLKEIMEKIQKADPWIHHNDDLQQTKRIAEFISNIVND